MRACEAEPTQASLALLPIVMERRLEAIRLRMPAPSTSAPAAVEVIIGDASVRVSSVPDEVLVRAVFRYLGP